MQSLEEAERNAYGCVLGEAERHESRVDGTGTALLRISDDDLSLAGSVLSENDIAYEVEEDE